LPVDSTVNVLSTLFAYEGLMAFFLEAAFLGVLLFGRKLVLPWAYFISALMVAVGTLFSSFWILAANTAPASQHATQEWQLKLRYCRERGAYLRIASPGRW
jgi:cytochrome bd-type quinol oxidase subunit 1